MKLINKIFSIVILFLGMNLFFSQKITAQTIDKPSQGKSLVYILRTGAGPLLNFRIYDGEKFLGALSGFKYMVYETEPGKHIFWAASENRDYIEANLKPDSVYVLNAAGQMGAFVAGVSFSPLNPNLFPDKRTFYQVVKSSTKVTYTLSADDKSENVQKGMAKYNELKSKDAQKIRTLDPSWTFENADKPVKDK